ncbi:hypothetical protein LTR78_006482 [Recurvomyces mirabilis]|uniref:S-adenosyl-L-methionine-dependent methyltransferase n=1 Tax=Recurvomyces mirabilis TaxID=574656 RepID=A0AAE0WKV9_9PEZI|nr:hypothetical protein LTR78_006482 [Recurvomyces mirabilis]KAK5151099.1 hypothetical protein LTS14_009595 [Recurvomyces mirabilis]
MPNFQFDPIEIDEAQARTAIAGSETAVVTELQQRSYHKFEDSTYPLPNDSTEVKRLGKSRSLVEFAILVSTYALEEYQHRLWQLCLKAHSHLARITAPKHALDIGCGPGMWVLDFAHQYPDCQVTGMDLSNVWPSEIPANADFRTGDFMAEWKYPQRFDFIHSRAVGTGIKSWPQLLERCFENLKPAGWVEFHEFYFPARVDDDSMKECPAFEKWTQTWTNGMNKIGRNIKGVLDVPNALRDRGFVNVHHESTKWPIGPWAIGDRQKQLGEMMEGNLCNALDAATTRLFVQVLGWRENDVQHHLREVEADIRSRKAHAYIPM